MAIQGKIATFYEDNEKLKPIFPETKTKAITNELGNNLDSIISETNNNINSLQNSINSKTEISLLQINVFSDGWTKETNYYVGTFSAPGLNSQDNFIVDLDWKNIPDKALAFDWQNSIITAECSTNGQIKFYTENLPTQTYPLRILIFK